MITNTCIHTYTYTYTHIHIHIYTYILITPVSLTVAQVMCISVFPEIKKIKQSYSHALNVQKARLCRQYVYVYDIVYRPLLHLYNLCADHMYIYMMCAQTKDTFT